MANLAADRLERIHKKLVTAAELYPWLRFLMVRPHDSLIPWPEFPDGPNAYSIGLSPGWWKTILKDLALDESWLPMQSHPWLSVGDELWEGAFYSNASVEARLNDPHREMKQFDAGVNEFDRLAAICADHFEMPPDPNFWSTGVGQLQPKSSHRWLEKLTSLGLLETCNGCSTQVRRLKSNVFAASARAIEILSSSRSSPLHSAIDAANDAWTKGFAIVAAAINEVLAEKGHNSRITCEPVAPGTTLLSCRQSLKLAFRDIPYQISNFAAADSDTWKPWPVGYSNDTTNPMWFLGFNYASVTGDELSQTISVLREKPADWPWHANIVEPVEKVARGWVTFCEQMRVRASELSSQPVLVTSPPVSVEAIYLGGGRVQIGDEVVTLEVSEAQVIDSLIALRSATKQQLINESGVSDVHRVLKRIKQKLPKLAAFIILPGGRGRGGYRTTIRRPRA